MEKVKICRGCKEKCSRPTERRNKGVCTRIINLPDQWEVVRILSEKGYHFTEEMLFQLQKKGIGPYFYLTNKDLRLLWEIRTGRRKRAKIKVPSIASVFFLNNYVDLNPGTKAIQNYGGLGHGPIKQELDPEPFDWIRRPELIGFYFNGPFIDQVAEIEEGFFPIHVFLPAPKKEISKRREDLIEKLHLKGRGEAHRNIFFKLYFKMQSDEGVPSHRIYREISESYRKSTGLLITPDSIKNIVHGH